jgi:hypothetical protein
MTATDRPEGSTASESLEWAEVDACTLPTAERPLRMAAFDDLFGTYCETSQAPPISAMGRGRTGSATSPRS